MPRINEKQKTLKQLEKDLLYKKYENTEIDEEIKAVQTEFTDSIYRLTLQAELLKKQKEIKSTQYKKLLESINAENYSFEIKIKKMKDILASLLFNRNKVQNSIVQVIENEQKKVY